MGNLTIATIFIVLINVLMWFSQAAILDINPDGPMCYNLEGTIIAESIINGTGVNSSIDGAVLDNDVENSLPEAQGSVVAGGTTNIFTDIFNSVLSWFKTAPGIKYIYNVVAAPYNILKCTGLPNMIILGFGTLWYLTTLLVLIAFMWGRD